MVKVTGSLAEISSYASEKGICTTEMDNSFGRYWSTSFCVEIINTCKEIGSYHKETVSYVAYCKIALGQETNKFGNELQVCTSMQVIIVLSPTHQNYLYSNYLSHIWYLLIVSHI